MPVACCFSHVALIVSSFVRLTIHSKQAAQLLCPTNHRPSLHKPHLLAINYNKALGVREVGDPGPGTNLSDFSALVSPSVEGAEHSCPASSLEDLVT